MSSRHRAILSIKPCDNVNQQQINFHVETGSSQSLRKVVPEKKGDCRVGETEKTSNFVLAYRGAPEQARRKKLKCGKLLMSWKEESAHFGIKKGKVSLTSPVEEKAQV